MKGGSLFLLRTCSPQFVLRKNSVGWNFTTRRTIRHLRRIPVSLFQTNMYIYVANNVLNLTGHSTRKYSRTCINLCYRYVLQCSNEELLLLWSQFSSLAVTRFPKVQTLSRCFRARESEAPVRVGGRRPRDGDISSEASESGSGSSSDGSEESEPEVPVKRQSVGERKTKRLAKRSVRRTSHKNKKDRSRSGVQASENRRRADRGGHQEPAVPVSEKAVNIETPPPTPTLAQEMPSTLDEWSENSQKQ